MEAAAGIYRMINTNMAEGIRLVSVRRGVDPRKFALLTFGGAAGLHVAEVARQLEIKRVIVPRVAAVLSAWGMLATDLRFEVSRTHIGAGARITADEGASCSPRWSSRPPAGCAPRSTGRLRSSARSKCATASRSSRSPCRSTASTGTRPIWSPDRRAVSRPARGTLHLRLARPGSRVGQRPRRRRRRGGAADRDARKPQHPVLAAARPAAGLLRRLARSAGLRARRLAARPHTVRPRHHRGRNHDRAGRYRRPRHVNALGWLDIALR